MESITTSGNLDDEINTYEEMVKSLSIEEFSELIDENNINKSFEAPKVAIRKKYTQKYYNEWVHHTFKEFINNSISNSKVSDLTKKILYNKVKEKDIETSKDSFGRFESLTYIVNEIQLSDKDNYTCTVFSIKKGGTKLSTNYAYLYSNVLPLDYENSNYDLSVSHKYFCTGPNLLSCDGEYRGRFTNIYTLEKVKLNFIDLWEEVEDYLLNESGVEFNQQYYLLYDLKEESKSHFEENLSAHRFAISLYIIAWLNYTLMKYLKLQNKHISKNYENIMTGKGDILFINNIINKYGLDKLKLFYWESGCINRMENIKSKRFLKFNPSLGQKIIPLSRTELQFTKDMNYPSWREFYISQLISDLVVNLICPGLPVTYEWFYINNADKNLYNNPVLYSRIQLSDKEEVVTDSISGYPSDKVLSMENCNNSTGLSNRSIVIISEYVGRTVNDISSSLKSEEYRKSIGSIFSNYNTFSKYLFDIIYALLCINSKLGIIHGDLHLNNSTIQHIYKTYVHNTVKLERHSYYMIEDDIFMFKDTGRVGTVIDFSRCFLLPGVDDKKILDIQIDRIIKYYDDLFPDFMKSYSNKLEEYLVKNFAAVYKLFSAVDAYIHTDRLLIFIEKNDILNTTEKVIKLARKVNNLSREFLTSHTIELINNDKIINEYPNYTILKQCFSEYRIDKNNKLEELSDIYFYNNELDYSLNSYKKLPDRIKYSKIKKPGEDNSIELINTEYSTSSIKKHYLLKEIQ